MIKPFYIIGMNLVYLFDTMITCLLIIIIKWATSFIKIFKLRLLGAVSTATNSNFDYESLKPCSIKLFEWKRQLSLVFQLIDRSNSLFGLFVLLFLYYRFVSIISCAFVVCSSKKEDTFYTYYYFSSLFSEIFKLWMMIYICHQLQSEVFFTI